MAKAIEQIAKRLDARRVGQVPDTGGGAFGAARLTKITVAERDAGHGMPAPKKMAEMRKIFDKKQER